MDNPMKYLLRLTAAALGLMAALTPPAYGFRPASQEDEKLSKAQKQIIEVERQWDTAVINKDRPTIERLLADDFLATDIYGNVHTREDYIRALTAPEAVYDFHHSDRITVHSYGDTAVAVGLVSVKARFDNQDISNDSRYTRVYIKIHGHWVAVVEQTTRMPAVK
jgi:ketosteroid isomerase-like protein